MPAPLDWSTAAATGVRLVDEGPRPSARASAAIVADLRAAAARAEGYVRDLTHLDPPGGSTTYVIERPSWIRANTASLAPVLARIDARDHPGPGDDPAPQDPGPHDAAGTGAGAVGLLRSGASKVTGASTGALLAVLATRVLGQYDVLHALGHPRQEGRLLLVAPNIHAAAGAMRVRPRDFRLWVCLHEQTHRIQHGQAPWLAPYMTELVSRAAGGARSAREAMDSITALMSVIEGHADVVMDQVGPDVIPTIATLRRRLEQRRDNPPVLTRLLGRLVGADRKLRQYREGAAFCRAVQARVGIDGFNRVLESPAMMPTLAELHAPEQWVRRAA